MLRLTAVFGLSTRGNPLPLPATLGRPQRLAAAFATTAPWRHQQLPPRPKPPPDDELIESYLKGSGPGGQKINKTNSAVQLTHIPTGIVVKSQATRSRSQNRKHAREILAARLDELRNGDASRTAIVGEVKRKKKASASKKSQRKHRKSEDSDADAEPDGEARDAGAQDSAKEHS